MKGMRLQAHAVYLDDMRDPDFAGVMPKLRAEPSRTGRVLAYTKRAARRLAETYGIAYIFAQYLTDKGTFSLTLTHICTPSGCKAVK